ncbi:condensation domain-containing protein [Amycolatopsis keratiniphila]|uniref:N-(5-amino-5-carboxypentanoyl)-L-cysteinyl-D-valine synthase n=1 Tax=Amycolatopsis keratiniphila TaxID=129921 RepID=R4SX89_9PSEU|nr:condensation domain-containing protein [Amycolatopsis keratiniphila]AGM07929.1 N-(5-amino-5-carboxypentanoyl)-L-cysteinyl-D-valine synthase [Amycolatopsis keratiniphila]
MSEVRTTIAELSMRNRAALLAELRGRDRPVRRGLDSAPATFQQRALWFLDRLSPTSTAYNMPVHLRLTGPLDVTALRRAFAAVVRRHDALRTRLTERDGQPQLEVIPDVPHGLRTAEAPDTATALEQAAQLGARPIDLTSAPLWRAKLWRIGPAEHVCTFAGHHAILDGTSLAILWRDLADHYRAEVDVNEAGGPRPVPPITYADFAAWQHDRVTSSAWRRSRRYWLENLHDLPTLALPTDRPRPSAPTGAGGIRTAPVPPETAAAVLRLARTEGTTPFTVHLAAFWLHLGRHANQDDIAVGTATEGRPVAEVAEVLGYFASMVVLRGDLGGTPTFRELVSRAAATTRQALAHADLPWELLVDAVAPDRDLGRSPLFQVGFGAAEQLAPPSFGEVHAEEVHQDLGTARFDLNWTVTLGSSGEVVVEYSTDLYHPATVDTMIESYLELLRSRLSEPDVPTSVTVTKAAEIRVVDDEDDYVAPECPTEHELTEEFAQVLARSGVGTRTNFFRAGGSSLQAAQLIAAIRERFAVELTVLEFFRTPTIGGLAVRIDRRRAARLDDGALVDLIETLSDDEVERLLTVVD